MRRHDVIIDTDPGVDDCAAILAALASPEINLLGVSVVAGNVALPDALVNACRIVALSGRNDVPVHPGAPGPLVRPQVYGKYAKIGAFSPELVPPDGITPSQEHAVDFIVRSTREAARAEKPLTICAIGPLTNIALALVRHREVAHGIGRIVAMGGAFAVPGHRTPWAEFNVYADPHAAAIVYRSGIPLVLMPLDVTTQALFTKAHITQFSTRGGAPGAALFNLLTAFDRSDIARYGRPGAPLHDAMTIAWLLRPRLFATRDAFIDVNVGGSTPGHTWANFRANSRADSRADFREDFHGSTDRAPNARVAKSVDEAGFVEWLIERIASFGSAASGVAPRGDRTP
jgi:purine nucleosidase